MLQNETIHSECIDISNFLVPCFSGLTFSPTHRKSACAMREEIDQTDRWTDNTTRLHKWLLTTILDRVGGGGGQTL